MKNENSVCFVAKIKEINPIPGADNIEVAVVEGWNCITKKGEYNVGDKVVVATTDAIIPEDLATSMNVTNYLRKGNRVRTVKLRGVYSECLLIPFRYLLPTNMEQKVHEGDDMMEMLGITKYEPPVKYVQLSSGGRKIKYKDNPKFQVYYKFPNIKNVPSIFNENDEVQITRKIHGTNARFGIVKKINFTIWDKIRIHLKKVYGVGPASWDFLDLDYIVGSHNVEKGSDSQGFYDTNVWYEISDRYNIKNNLYSIVKILGRSYIGDGIIIYGEIYGAGIQKNYDYGLKDIDLVCFDVVLDKEYLSMQDVKWIVTELKLPHVPILYEGLWSKEIQDKFVINNFISGTKIPHEGVVIKALDGNRAKTAKVINPEYLIYAEKHDVSDSH